MFYKNLSSRYICAVKGKRGYQFSIIFTVQEFSVDLVCLKFIVKTTTSIREM